MQVIDPPLLDSEREVEHDLQEIGAAWSRLLRRSMTPRAQEYWAEAAGVQMDRASYWLLRELGEAGQLRLSELSQRQGTDVSTVCRQIRSCEDAGLVRRKNDPSDMRAVLFALTDKGRQALERLQAVRMEVYGRVFADWPAEDRREFARLTKRFVDGYLQALGTKP